MMVLKSLGVLSVGKVMGVMYAIFGLIAGCFFALIALAGAAMPQPQPGVGPNPIAALAGLGIASIIVMPIIYGIVGFVGGIISALIYNVIAGIAGGIELNFEQPASSRNLS